MLTSLEFLASLALICGPVNAAPTPPSNLVVTASTGTYTGIVNGTAPSVRQFLNIPYAAPPTGQRRWLPPANLTTNSSTLFDATQYAPSCPQYISKVPSVYNEDVPQYDIPPGSENTTAGLFAETSSEDCLSLAIWTPQNASGLPVLMFITGGGFQTGGIDIAYQLPYHWVQRTQAHIVVTIKYGRLLQCESGSTEN